MKLAWVAFQTIVMKEIRRFTRIWGTNFGTTGDHHDFVFCDFWSINRQSYWGDGPVSV
ncbi:hypothetical protein AAUPMC_05192, partial [Pasteurella multocida subsp. multocida str. Anand1_cattle]